jgi:hypothetical protein
MQNETWIRNDGGRKDAGYKGSAGDCGVRAISIAMQRPYQQIYDEMNVFLKTQKYSAKMRGMSSSRNGIHGKFFREYMLTKGWKWTATMLIGQGCKTHLCKEELPMGRIICNVSKHYVAVIDGIIHDTHDCSRNGTRCVYGYWSK